MTTHRQIAHDVGLSVASISRLRAGERIPSLPGMRKINRVLGWAPEDQFACAVTNGVAGWRDEFEKRLREYYDANDASAPVSDRGDGVAPSGEAGSAGG